MESFIAMYKPVRFYWDLEFVQANNPSVNPLALVESACASILWSLHSLSSHTLAASDCLVETSSRVIDSTVRYSFHIKVAQNTLAAKSLSTIIKTTNYMMSELTLALTDESHPLAMHAHNLLVCPGAICTEKTWIFDVRAYEINFSSLRTLGSRKRGHMTSCKRSIGPVTLIVAKDLEPVDQCPPFGFDAWQESLVVNVMTPVRVFTFPNLDAKGRGRMLAASKAHLRKLQNGDDFSYGNGN